MKLHAPKAGTRFGSRGGRLALFNDGLAQSEYWRSYWRDTSSAGLVQSGHDGEIPELADIIGRWAPRDLPVLEAGCGPGHFVAALSSKGYRAIGIEYESDVVARARQQHPNLDIRVGDVRALELETGSVGCYLSLGVIEHFAEGPREVLREARRVTVDNGVALISVPYLNTLRAQFFDAGNLGDVRDAKFHQYYFSANEMAAFVGEAGFEIVERHGYAVEAFLCREHPWFSRFWKSSLARTRIKNQLRRRFEKLPVAMRERYAHMALFVCMPR